MEVAPSKLTKFGNCGQDCVTQVGCALGANTPNLHGANCANCHVEESQARTVAKVSHDYGWLEERDMKRILVLLCD